MNLPDIGSISLGWNFVETLPGKVWGNEAFSLMKSQTLDALAALILLRSLMTLGFVQ